MKFDLHTHHQRCGHAVATIEAYILAAIEAGLAIIGIADHAPLFFMEDDHPEPGLAMSKTGISALYRGSAAPKRSISRSD